VTIAMSSIYGRRGDAASGRREDEEESVPGLGPQEHGERHWPTMAQLCVAVSKLREDLDEL
jgi:hypothetical protein